jgi:hypothetical protein
MREPSRFRAILALITGLLGSTVGLLFAAFGLLSLPLSMVAVMHLTGRSWFGAIIGVLLFSCIPLVGQIGYPILAVMGAYYLWAVNFDWQQAAYPSAQTFRVPYRGSVNPTPLGGMGSSRKRASSRLL